jgi:hypothetical protein
MTPPRNGTEPETQAAPSAPVGEGSQATASKVFGLPSPLALSTATAGSPDAAPGAPADEEPQAHSTEALDDFARGTIDALRQICASLIGRDLVAKDLQTDMRRLAEFWRANGVLRRAEPAEILAEALGDMAKERREVAANIFPPNKGRN